MEKPSALTPDKRGKKPAANTQEDNTPSLTKTKIEKQATVVKSWSAENSQGADNFAPSLSFRFGQDTTRNKKYPDDSQPVKDASDNDELMKDVQPITTAPGFSFSFFCTVQYILFWALFRNSHLHVLQNLEKQRLWLQNRLGEHL